MIYQIVHQTRYEYSEPVSLCHNLAHLAPRPVPQQACRSSELAITPEPALVDRFADYFGNPVQFFAIQEPHRQLVVESALEVEVMPSASSAAGTGLAWEMVCDQLPAQFEAFPFVFDSPFIHASTELAGYAAASFPAGRPLLEAAMDLTHRIHAEFRYDPKATTLATPLPKVLSQRSGVCQDFAHLMIGCLRSLGLSARYVSGYLSTDAPPGKPRLVGADASHAWVAVFCPGIGWTDFDPTNDVIPSSRHITLAWGRDYGDVSPVQGVVLGGGEHELQVAVTVTTRCP
jgi:transglutaminase-like putative cysteine protease